MCSSRVVGSVDVSVEVARTGRRVSVGPSVISTETLTGESVSPGIEDVRGTGVVMDRGLCGE